MDSFIGEIRAFAFDYAPEGWMFCNGGVYNKNQNMALFTIISTTYGGSDSAPRLPDLRSRLAVQHVSGTFGGVLASNDAAVTLTLNQMPAHTHTLNAGASAAANSDIVPVAGSSAFFRAAYNQGTTNYIYQTYSPGSANSTLASAAFSTSYGGLNGVAEPHENRQPFLNLNYCIAVDGAVYPVPA